MNTLRHLAAFTAFLVAISVASSTAATNDSEVLIIPPRTGGADVGQYVGRRVTVVGTLRLRADSVSVENHCTYVILPRSPKDSAAHAKKYVLLSDKPVTATSTLHASTDLLQGQGQLYYFFWEDEATITQTRRFDTVDGSSTKGEFIDTNRKTSERLYLRYPLHSDGGAELELTAGESLLWREYVQPLGIEHSAYRQDASMRVSDGKIFVTISGAKTIKEVRELKTGKLISREVADNASK